MAIELKSMSLKGKIVFSFFISAFIIAILVAYEYINFIRIREEIRHLEIADTIRNKSLEIRRHEKNFFLYWLVEGDKESKAIHNYLRELNVILGNKLTSGETGRFVRLKNLIDEYEQRFNKIELSGKDLLEGFKKTKYAYGKYNNLSRLIEISFLEQPLQVADFLEKAFLFHPNHPLISGLRELDSEIKALRKNGENILTISEELDKTAREKAEQVINISQIAILILFPLFFISGIGMLFFITKDVVNRLKLLIDTVEKTGKGYFAKVAPSRKWGGDEVGVLMQKLNDMEGQLAQWEDELKKKNKELLQNKKLTAIGTLASGVAHELNNPLNNIYISAQVLAKEGGDGCSPIAKEIINDIVGQTTRVKRIVGDLLEFARGSDPRFVEVELNNLITKAYKFVTHSINTKDIKFVLDSDPNGVATYADPEQMERVFINLFNNAIDAMSGTGELTVKLKSEDQFVNIRVSDTGKGMSGETIDKIFEPFFTLKDKSTGLGLAIIFNIIKKHNGEISVESKEGKGTTFTITLPKTTDGEL